MNRVTKALLLSLMICIGWNNSVAQRNNQFEVFPESVKLADNRTMIGEVDYDFKRDFIQVKFPTNYLLTKLLK